MRHEDESDPRRVSDGRGREPGQHPTVARSGRSRSTWIALLGVIAGAVILYALIVAGISLPGM